jgi:pimeloyl-ACP methyl ester carboxylesterase
MGTTGYSWRYVLEPLARRFRLLVPDLPGAGDSDHPDVELSAGAMAQAIITIIDALGARGAPVIGNSMGGYLCMRAALLDPAVMSRLVNLHSPGVPTAKMTALRWVMRLLPSWPVLDRMIRRDPERWVHKNVHYWNESLKSREEHRSTPHRYASAPAAAHTTASSATRSTRDT